MFWKIDEFHFINHSFVRYFKFIRNEKKKNWNTIIQFLISSFFRYGRKLRHKVQYYAFHVLQLEQSMQLRRQRRIQLLAEYDGTHAYVYGSNTSTPSWQIHL